MTKNMKKMSAAAVAGASSLSLLAGHSARAALTITWTETPSVTTQDGVMDKYLFTLSSMTGLDATTGPLGQDPQILLFEGTFSAVEAGGSLLNPGTDAPGGGANWTKYITAPNTQNASVKGANSPTGSNSSFVYLGNQNGALPPSRTGTTNASVSGGSGTSSSFTTTHGESKSFTASWFVTPSGSTGNVGGIEPGTNGGKLAVIYVAHGDNVSFTGDYQDYQTGLQPESFSTAGGAVTTGNSTHNIVSLTSATQAGGSYGVQLTSGTGANQATFAPNAPVPGTINVTKVGAGAYIPGFANGVSGATAGTGAIADFAAISGFAAGDQEIYALKLLVGGTAPTTTQMNSIVADIGGQSGDGVNTVASLIGSPTGLAGQIAGLFPGYDLMLTVTSGSATPFLGFDFSQETNVAGVVVTNIAAVPEPASAAILLIGSGLILGRRKRNAL